MGGRLVSGHEQPFGNETPQLLRSIQPSDVEFRRRRGDGSAAGYPRLALPQQASTNKRVDVTRIHPHPLGGRITRTCTPGRPARSGYPDRHCSPGVAFLRHNRPPWNSYRPLPAGWRAH